MITISAFADEIGPELKLQMDVCERHGVQAIDVRAIDGVNVSKIPTDKARQYRRQLDDRGFIVPCLGSPLGKVKLDDDFDAHLDLLKHCIELAGGFGTDQIRVFSFYAPDGDDITRHRDEVMDRLGRMVDLAADAGVYLLHENEARIYGDVPQRVIEIRQAIDSPHLRLVFDPANYVHEGLKPYDDCWKAGLAEITDYFHIKDKVPGEAACCPAGEGAGQIEEICREIVGEDFVMTLEPHLAKAGQFAGFTGPDLFAKAVNGLKGILDRVGVQYQ